jgi:D-aminoacyl-tRNA deacylase
MIGLLQRVSRADVSIEGEVVAQIGHGLLVLVGVERGDTPAGADRLAERLLNYRVFADPQGRMNLNVTEVGGSILVVPQFTLAADTTRGNRPGFSGAAEPESGRRLFQRLLESLSTGAVPVAGGRFGADMQVGLVNDGPVTFWLRVAPGGGADR